MQAFCVIDRQMGPSEAATAPGGLEGLGMLPGTFAERENAWDMGLVLDEEQEDDVLGLI